MIYLTGCSSEFDLSQLPSDVRTGPVNRSPVADLDLELIGAVSIQLEERYQYYGSKLIRCSYEFSRPSRFLRDSTSFDGSSYEFSYFCLLPREGERERERGESSRLWQHELTLGQKRKNKIGSSWFKTLLNF